MIYPASFSYVLRTHAKTISQVQMRIVLKPRIDIIRKLRFSMARQHAARV